MELRKQPRFSITLRRHHNTNLSKDRTWDYDKNDVVLGACPYQNR